MDGVERIMVLGIFAVIVAILSIAAWGVTNDDGGSVFATDGGVIDRPSDTVVSSTGGALQAEDGSAGGAAVAKSGEGGASSTRDGTPAGRAQRGRKDSAARPGAVPLKSHVPRGPDLIGEGPNSQGIRGAGGKLDDAPKLSGTQPKPAGPKYVQAKVVKGDTVWSIARSHFGEGDTAGQVRLIQQLNPAIDIDNITEGDVLRLPAELPEEVTSKPVKQQVRPGTRLYTIGAGETLWAIAEEQLGDRKLWNDIYQLNRQTISEPDKVYEGMTILLPEG